MRANRHSRILGSFCLSLVVAAGSFACASSSQDDDTVQSTTTIVTTTTNPEAIVAPIDEVRVGQCLDDLPEVDQRRYAVLVVPCDDPHVYEVYDQQEFYSEESTAPGTEFPGDVVVFNGAETQCIVEFESFIGVPWEASEYDVQVWWPTESSWTEDDDRAVTCAVFRINGGLSTGTARDSKG